MKRMMAVITMAALVALSADARAQEPPADPSERLRRLEERLDALQRENGALRSEVETLKRELGADAEPAEDLTALALAPAPASVPAPAEPPIDLVQNPPAASSGKVFNPDIAVVGNFLGRMGDPHPFEERPALAMEESEISFQAFVDPYAQAKFYLAVSEEGAELEEGFVQFVALPHDFTARAGKLKAAFGKVNLMHAHQLPWVDKPLVHETYFGEALADSGISVSRIFPNRLGLFVEATGEVHSGEVEGVFERESANDLFYLAHVKTDRDLSEQTKVELGASFARGTLAESGGHNEFAGLDLTFRYKPLRRAIYRSLVSRTELISNRRPDSDERALGFYTSLDYQFARRWFAGIRLDRAERPGDPDTLDRGGSLLLTFWPSEFSQLRAQARRARFGGEAWVNELLLQVQFSIGAHGAHTF